MIRTTISLFFLLYLLPFIASAQITSADYERAVSFMYSNLNNKTVYNLYTRVTWLKNKEGIYFVDYTESGKTYQYVAFENPKVQPLFDHQKLAEALSKVLGEKMEATDLPLNRLDKDDEGRLVFTAKGETYHYDEKTNTVEIADLEEGQVEPDESKSPDGKWIAFTKDFNLYIKSTSNQEVHQLSYDGHKNYEYAHRYAWMDKMEGENGARPQHFQVTWSADSKWLTTHVWDLRNASKMYLLDWSVDTLYRPRLLSYYRGSPGDTNMVHAKPVFFNIEERKEVKTSLPKNTHINSVFIQWAKKSGIAFARYAERGYKKEHILKVDLNTNTITPLITETSPTNIDNFDSRILEDLGKIVFTSERSGWNQLYAFDLSNHSITPLTQGEYYINDIEYIDEKKGIIYFLASGKDPQNNLYHQQLYKVNLSGELTLLTPEKKHHIISFSEDGKYFVDNYSTIQSPTQTALREAETGKVLAELTTAEVSQKTALGWQPPQVFELTGKDGQTTIYGALWKPTNFDPLKKYPIIDHSYTGPHTQVFPKSFDRAFRNQSLAELGFIVMQVDGLGTSGRSKAFHDHSYKNMGNNLEDHVLAIQYLSKKYAWIDGERVGIFGHSAGGYDAGHAMLAFPEVYKVGVASSADHDFRMEKAWWPEMYMGWPVDESYEKVSNITMAGNLKGKLLLAHGALDDNVNPSATFKLAEALVKADKEFDLLIFPSQRHGYRGKFRLYFMKKRWNYFVRHLLGAEPIWDFEIPEG